MLLGKRPRHPMKRTTSLSEITFDLNTIENVSTHEAEAANSQPSDLGNNSNSTQTAAAAAAAAAGFLGQLDQRLLGSVPSPRNDRRASAEFLETAHFLRSCSLCKRCLVHGRDIYMYRGDSAFCSLECRQQQMNQDERKEKCSLASKKEVAATSSTTQSQVSAEGETVAAV